MRRGANLVALSRRSMQYPENIVPRICLPRTPVNNLRHRHETPLGISLSVVSSTTSRTIMRQIWRLLLGLVVALLALAVAGAIYQAIATEVAERAYPPP